MHAPSNPASGGKRRRNQTRGPSAPKAKGPCSNSSSIFTTIISSSSSSSSITINLISSSSSITISLISSSSSSSKSSALTQAALLLPL
ncbi:hypothetical protein Emed_005695 [Eimeria media]